VLESFEHGWGDCLLAYGRMNLLLGVLLVSCLVFYGGLYISMSQTEKSSKVKVGLEGKMGMTM
jgi:hypothetical protein